MEFAELYKRLKKEKTELLEKLEQLRALGQPSAERKEGSPFGKREEEADEASELEKRLVMVTSTAPTGKPAVTVSTVVTMQYMVAKSMMEIPVKLSE